MSLFIQPCLVRSGNVNSDSTLNNPGERANYWSRSSYNASQARNLNINSSDVYPSNNNNRYNGRSLRCLVSVPDLLP